MPHLLLLFSLALTLALTLSAAGGDWTQFRGPTGSGVSAEKGLPAKWGAKENVAWKTEMPGPGSSSPVFVGDRIFITCYTGYNVPGQPKGEQADLRRHLLTLDRKTGKILANKEIEAKLPEQEKIRDNHGYASSTPAVDADRVYCFFGKSGEFAFDHAGKQLWQADVGNGLSDWGSAASPVLHGDLVFVNASVESQTLFAFDKKTGKEKWSAKGIKASWNTPLVVKTKDGKDELVVAIEGKVLAFDPVSGAALWSCATDITWYMVPSLVAHDGVVYALGGRSGNAALAVRRRDGRRDEDAPAVDEQEGVERAVAGVPRRPPVLDERGEWDGAVREGRDRRGGVRGARPAAGRRVRVVAAGRRADALPVAQRRTFVVAAKPEYEFVATNDLRDGSLFHAAPVAVDGRLFIRSDKFLYCLEKQ